MRIKRKYLPILAGSNLRNGCPDGAVCNYIDPDLDTQEDADEDVDTVVGASNAREDASATHRLH